MLRKFALPCVLLTSGLLSSHALANTCYRATPTNGPSQPDTCVDIKIKEMHGTQITLEANVATIGSDFSDDMQWHSNIDGALGYGKSITANLTPGKHNITAGFGWPHSPYYMDKTSIVVREKRCINESPSTALTTEVWYGIRFTNQEERDIKVYWSRYTSADRLLYSTLSQGQSVTLNGYPGNKWVITDEYDNCISSHESTFEDQTVNVEFDY